MSDTAPNRPSAWRDWPLDLEIVLTRLIDAPRALVYAAWADPAQIQMWFGPAGFAVETHEMDLRPGGRWRFDMVAPDGTRYSNRMVFLRLEEATFIEVEHGEDKDDDPGRFRTLITFDEQDNGKTVLTLRQMHPTKQQREWAIGFGAVEYGLQTLQKLADHVASRTGK
jgi:uncharacterized protein YndB with AHSA1/START domain